MSKSSIDYIKGQEDLAVFYPLYDLAKVRQQDLLAAAHSACILDQAYLAVPTIMDRILIGLGDILISIGQKVRSGSAFARPLHSGS
jgi:hypothetical protein